MDDIDATIKSLEILIGEQGVCLSFNCKPNTNTIANRSTCPLYEKCSADLAKGRYYDRADVINDATNLLKELQFKKALDEVLLIPK